MSDSNTKVLQNPQIRVLDQGRASLKIGDRVPIATGSFTPGVGGGSISPLVNTQFQYLDVGVNIDITPHVHSNHEVTLKMSLEVSSVTGLQNIGGISQPTIGQRRIEHETRLQDGEINLVGGILSDTETQSLSGYPWLARIPILKYLFGQEDKQRHDKEIVFVITPHILRAEEVTDENLRLIDIGTASAIGLRRKEVKKPSQFCNSQYPPDAQFNGTAKPACNYQRASFVAVSTPRMGVKRYRAGRSTRGPTSNKSGTYESRLACRPSAVQFPNCAKLL